ncbi:MAG: MBL fold metallo-hydrolase, partial [Erysipelotrichaceae bacterium]|nr:MBL fold metallo-hydrolase [Erysipelotrichaceae bacterium]
DAILITDGEHNILVDTGYRETAEQLTARLKELNVTSLDLLILTHFDKDHIGGAAAIIDGFNVQEILQGGYVKDSSHYSSYIQALRRKGITAKLVDRDLERSYGSLRLRINPPAEKEYEKNPSNNSSLITMLDFHDYSFLLMGDAENLRLKEYADLAVTAETNVILKVPHHGDYHKNLALILDRYHPLASVICCSETDPEPAEVEKTCALLSQYGSEIYRTPLGEVWIAIDQGKITIRQ